MRSRTDQTLIRQYLQGDTEALGELYDRYADKLYGLMYNILQNHESTQECLQRFFFNLMRRAQTVLSANNIKHYLLTSARNTVFSYLREEKIRKHSDLSPVLADPTKQSDSIFLEEALSSLPREQREVVYLKITEGLSFREIGQTLGIPHKTAASRYEYGIKKLKRTW